MFRTLLITVNNPISKQSEVLYLKIAYTDWYLNIRELSFPVLKFNWQLYKKAFDTKKLHRCGIESMSFSLPKNKCAFRIWRATRLYGSDCCDEISSYFPQFQIRNYSQKLYHKWIDLSSALYLHNTATM